MTTEITQNKFMVTVYSVPPGNIFRITNTYFIVTRLDQVVALNGGELALSTRLDRAESFVINSGDSWSIDYFNTLFNDVKIEGVNKIIFKDY